MAEPLMALEGVSQVFRVSRGELLAVDAVSLSLEAGQVLCLVGESGSGKTTAAKMAAGLRRPTSGAILFEGQDIWQLNGEKFSAFRRAVQYVHQDPYASLNPVHSVFSQLAAPLRRHRLARNRREALRSAQQLLTQVDLTPPENFLFKYPHQLSGGQRQRVSVARALTLGPRLIIADEATSMLDVSIRISLLNMLKRLREQLGVAFLFITHDLAIAKYFGWEGNIAVMYLGRVVEYGPTPVVINEPRHPYTRALLRAIPEPDPDLTRRKREVGLRSLDIPSLLQVPPGCSFHPRCPLCEEGLCDAERPQLLTINGNRLVACHVVARESAQAARGVPPTRVPGGSGLEGGFPPQTGGEQ